MFACWGLTRTAILRYTRSKHCWNYHICTALTPKVETTTGKINKNLKHFPGPHRDFIGLDRLLRDSGKMTVGKIGNAVTRLIKARDVIDLMLAEGKKNPAFCLCNNAACTDCVKQHAAIRRHRLAQESFKLAIARFRCRTLCSGKLSTTCRRPGANYVELDSLNGQPAVKMAAEKLKAAVTEFTAAGIKVSALRLPAVPLALTPVLEAAQTAGINRLIMPLTEARARV